MKRIGLPGVAAMMTLVIMLSGSVGTVIAGDTCTAADRAQLKREGLSYKEIGEYCRGSDRASEEDDLPKSQRNSPRPYYPQSQRAVVCQTPVGACPMAIILPRGSSCVCFTPNGQISGIAQ